MKVPNSKISGQQTQQLYTSASSVNEALTVKNITEQKININNSQNLLLQQKIINPINNVAGEKMRMPEQNFIQRKCAHCEEEEKAQRTPLASFIQKKATENNSAVSDSVSNQIQSTKGNGNAMPDATKSFMENRFTTDFSNVKIHTGNYATQLSNQLNAQAFTIGNDIYFNEGKYQPESVQGKHLLAHELTHVLQQEKKSECIQRYETPEHQDLGDRALPELVEFLSTDEGKQWAKQYGYDPKKLVTDIRSDPFYNGAKLKLKTTEISWGDAIAMMGDYFGSVEELYNSPREKLRGTKETKGLKFTSFIGKAPSTFILGEHTIFHPGLLDIADKERKGEITDASSTIAKQEITGGDYLKLAEKNTAHFAPVNRETYLSMHKEAIKIASKSREEAALQKALLTDAAAGHFLTDAFASGHLIDHDKVLDAINIYLTQHPIESKIPGMQAIVGFASIKNKTQFLVLKIIHDHFNTAGHEVSNPKGMKWRTFGDAHLRKADEARHIAALAVFLSRKQIYDAHKGVTVNPKDITDLMPDDKTIEIVTKEAIDYIPQAADEVDAFMLSQKNAAEAQFGSIGGPIARYMLMQIDRRLQQSNILPDERPVTDILHPDFSIGADFILNRDDKSNPDSLHLDISVGQPQGHEFEKAIQGTIGIKYEW
jgi:hypothetical protein